MRTEAAFLRKQLGGATMGRISAGDGILYGATVAGGCWLALDLLDFGGLKVTRAAILAVCARACAKEECSGRA